MDCSLTIPPAQLTITSVAPQLQGLPIIRSKHRVSLRLRAGEWVEVRTLEDIVGTLDEHGCLDGLPFMPEMVQYCGKRFRVFKSAHKTCDTINHYEIRRMSDAVHLEGLRCDGGSHGGCQAGCLLFWKDAWLKRSHPGDARELDGQSRSAAATGAPAAGHDLLQRATRVAADDDAGGELYRCQATEMLRATSHVRRRERWDPRFYLRDLTSGNVTVLDFIRYGLFAMVNAFMVHWRGRRYPHLCGLAGTRTPTAELNLHPGELVRVRSKHEIMQTLNPQLKNRGLWFDVEMVPHCGSIKRVLRRVERIVDEKTGRLIRLPQPCIILDGVTCSGNVSSNRMFCPRAIYPYWREIWLEHAETGASGSAASTAEESD